MCTNVLVTRVYGCMSATVLLIIKGTSADNYLNNTAASPLYYVRGGGIYLDTGSLRNAGLNNYYWSATTYPNATYAYYLYFHSTNVYPSYYYDRFVGFSVRGGDVDLDTGALRYAGIDSFYWSATTYPSATYAYLLDFNSTNVGPSYYNARFYGFSVSCIVFFFPFFLFLLSSFFFFLLLTSPFSLPYII